MIQDFGLILVCALRYALGRRTYITSIVADTIIHQIPNIGTKDLKVMLNDINTTSDLGDQCDIDNWTKLKSMLELEIQKREDCQRGLMERS